MIFKNLIRKYREALRLNQTQLGSIIGVTKNSISLYESNEMIPSAEIAYKLCFYLIVNLQIYFILLRSNYYENCC